MGFCPVWPSWMPPDVPAPARMPVAPSTLVNSIVPSLTTLLLLSSVTAGPATVGLIDPAEVILISSGAPDLIVEVRTGAVVAVAIVVSAWAAVERRVARQVEASKVLRIGFLLRAGPGRSRRKSQDRVGSDRKKDVSGKRGSGRVDIGGL